MLVIGADPGTQGAICLLDSIRKKFTFVNTPQLVTMQALYFWCTKAKGMGQLEQVTVAIEDVHSMGGMSAKSNFQFGRNLGFLEASLHLHFTDIVYVQPKEWQKVCGIKFVYPPKATAPQKSRIRKETTAAMVLELYPDAPIYGPRGGLMDGRADALMIAHYLTIRPGD